MARTNTFARARTRATYHHGHPAPGSAHATPCGLVHRRQPGAGQGSLEGSRELADRRTGSSALPFTGTSVTLPLLLLAVTLVLGGGLALRRGRVHYRPTHLRR